MWLEQTSNALCQINLTQSINLQYIFLSHIAVIYTVPGALERYIEKWFSFYTKHAITLFCVPC